MEQIARDLGALLVSTGPIGALVGGALVALALSVIAFAQVSGIFAERRAASQQNAFQQRLLDGLAAIQASEGRLRAENAELREEIDRLHAGQALMREQLRRALDALRRVSVGKLAPADVSIEAFGEEAP